MHCPNCGIKYATSPSALPRILIACGHTICEGCILTLGIAKEESEQTPPTTQDEPSDLSKDLTKSPDKIGACPECGKEYGSDFNSLSQFPKNIALLSINTPNKSQDLSARSNKDNTGRLNQSTNESGSQKGDHFEDDGDVSRLSDFSGLVGAVSGLSLIGD